MSARPPLRKVKEWVDVTGPRVWNAKLECGHIAVEYDDGIDEDSKSAAEAIGDRLSCVECGRAEAEIVRLEEQLRTAKARRRPRT